MCIRKQLNLKPVIVVVDTTWYVFVIKEVNPETGVIYNAPSPPRAVLWSV